MKILILILFAHQAFSQNINPKHPIVTWSAHVDKMDTDQYKITVTAQNPHTDWHFWTFHPGDESLIPTTINFAPSEAFRLIGDVIVQGAITTTQDEIFGEVSYFEGDVTFIYTIQSPLNQEISITIRYQACNATSCLPPVDVTLPLILN